MITAYHRPKTLEEALSLLSDSSRLPLGGGTLLSHGTGEPVEVVDLQALGLNQITRKGNDLAIGASVTLQQLMESTDCPQALKTALRLEAPLNVRNAATLAGTLVAADGRSPFATCLLALEAKLLVHRERQETVSLGEYLALRPGGLITAINMPVNAGLEFEGVARTPADKPFISVAVAKWPSGRTRISVGGFGKSPSLAMDGTEPEGLESAARNACHESGDEFASAEYRMEAAATLAKRCLGRIPGQPVSG